MNIIAKMIIRKIRMHIILSKNTCILSKILAISFEASKISFELSSSNSGCLLFVSWENEEFVAFCWYSSHQANYPLQDWKKMIILTIFINHKYIQNVAYRLLWACIVRSIWVLVIFTMHHPLSQSQSQRGKREVVCYP